MKRDFLLEIGCEEIPARILPSAQAQLGQLLEAELKTGKLLKESEIVRTWSTPRRLAAYCKNLLPVEPDRIEEMTGPPWSVAFDEQGKPTRAADGFARKAGVAVNALEKRSTPKGDYITAVVRHKGLSTKKILSDVLPELIGRISFPRTMYWTTPAGFRFIRPIRWIVALYGGSVVPFGLEDVRSGASSRGHRKLHNRPVRIAQAAQYERLLQKAGVIADPARRRKKIETAASKLLRARKLAMQPDEELLSTLANMTEHPAALLGSFSEEFLALPEEILITVMRHHQNYLAVVKKGGALVPNFIAVLDRDKDAKGGIRKGHEAVLEARFRDARFFWETDQRQSLDERLPMLDKVTFHSKLGTYGEKIRRVAQLAKWFAVKAEMDCRQADNVAPRKRRHADIAASKAKTAERRRADIDAAVRTAMLSKSDLTTQLVGELPELQGVAGGLYAKASGLPASVAAAIYEHHRPAGPEDETPSTPEGIVVAMADKLDTLAGCFCVGEEPTGSRDPLALRRAAAGIVRTILERRVSLNIEAANGEAVRIATEGLKVAGGDKALKRLADFLGERARYYFRETLGYPYDEVNAAFAVGWSDLVDLQARLEAIHSIRPSKNFEPLAASCKRIKNILDQAGGGKQFTGREVQSEIFKADPERQLYAKLQALQSDAEAIRADKDYAAALRRIASLRPAVDEFFDNVLVNAEDPDVRMNRLILLNNLLSEFSTIADFSEIVTS